MAGRLPYKIEYAKSDRSACQRCKSISFNTDSSKIERKEEIPRIGCLTVAYNFDGIRYEWYHFYCFFLKETPKSINQFAGFDNIRSEHQEIVREMIEKNNNKENTKETINEPSSSRKRCNKESDDLLMSPTCKNAKKESVDDEENRLLKKQTDEFFALKDKLEKLSNKDIEKLFWSNTQYPPRGRSEQLNALTDLMLFGRLQNCEKCSKTLRFESGVGYQCTGFKNAWSKCLYTTQNPLRTEFLIPEFFKTGKEKEYEVLKNYASQVKKRLMHIVATDEYTVKLVDTVRSQPDKVKNLIKDGLVVNFDSGLQGIAHVLQIGDNVYSVILSNADIGTGKNTFYILQILKHDTQDTYWLFRKWGRIGTGSIKSKKDQLAFEDCITQFEKHFEQKTLNNWQNRDRFKKRPGKYYLYDLDESFDYNEICNLESDIPSTLTKPVQDLMRLIFDVKMMKKVLLEYEIDVNQMPLGKLSEAHLIEAYEIIDRIQQLLDEGNPDETLFIDATNEFYTLIPHALDRQKPPILNSKEIIIAKSKMLKSLSDIEIAYKLLNKETRKNQNHLDAHYEQLNIEADVLDHDSEEFRLIEKYAKNTHAATHSTYTLEIEEVFTIKRHGENEQYKPFEKFPNRKLLWHGSETTNFAGILSQGLRIAPPEAPSSGYMFGKGIYFADMVSKSANYCYTNSQNPTGLLLLCEVALGNMYERHQADYIEKLPKGKHSTFGKGRTCPDPKQTCKLPNGVEVPCGTPIQANFSENLKLRHNEYIVYDVAQVKVQYLVLMKFKY